MVSRLLYSIIFSALGFTLIPQALADQDCSDIGNLTCKPGTYNDGTGIGRTFPASHSQASQYGKEVRAEIRSFFSAKINRGLGTNSTEFQVLLKKGGKDLPLKCINYIVEAAEKAKLKSKDSIKITINKETNISNEEISILSSSNKDKEKKGPQNWSECRELIIDNLESQALEALFPELSFQFIAPEKRHKNYLVDTDPFDLMIYDLQNHLREKFVDKDFIKRAESNFYKVKELFLNTTLNYTDDEKLKSKLRAKITSIEFKGTECGELVDNSVHGFFISNAFYNPEENNFKLCNGLGLTNQSLFHIVFVMAHELAHSIDPCILALPYKSKGDTKPAIIQYSHPHSPTISEYQNPFRKLIYCLRDSYSIKAARSKSQSFAAIPEKERKGLSSLCIVDQIGEAFADTLAAEILYQYIIKFFPNLKTELIKTGLTNTLRSHIECKQQKSKVFNEHPNRQDRINKGLLSSQKIRSLAQCKTPAEPLLDCFDIGKPKSQELPLLEAAPGER